MALLLERVTPFLFEKNPGKWYTPAMKNLIKKFIPKFILGWYHRSLALLAAARYGHPSEKMVVIGVTGTNGKSTTVNLIGRILEEVGFRVGWTTTANFKIAEREWLNDKKMTMLGRFALQKMLKEMVRAKCDYAIIETSSEGIKQFRHLGINYDVAVFTNLTPEHIESHGGFENYRAAKMELFRHTAKCKHKRIIKGDGFSVSPRKVSVVNVDDEHHPYFLQFQTEEAWGFGIAGRGDANLSRILRAENVRLESDGSHFAIEGEEFHLKLLGEFNVYNALAAATVAATQGMKFATAARALEKVAGMPGRVEFVDEGQSFLALVDYAPEPASLENLYKLLNDTGLRAKVKRVTHILGSTGGGRDVARRSILGSIAAKNADVVIVTNEDPYDDNPMTIIENVAEGAEKEGKMKNKNLFLILDREVAIEKAVAEAREGDLVLLTGKGCEQAMVVRGGKKIPWDDRERLRQAIRKRLNA